MHRAPRTQRSLLIAHCSRIMAGREPADGRRRGRGRRGNMGAVVETRYEHIVLDPAGVPYLAGTTMKVVELVTAQAAYGWSAEELHFQYPYLSLGQIHSALAY